MAARYNYTVDQGSDFTFTYTLNSGGVAVDLSGSTFKMDVRTKYKDTALVFQLTDGSGIDITNAASGILVITFTDTQTKLLTEKNYYYDIEQTDGSGIVTRRLQGLITVSYEVTD